ncbi:hypothetical protein BDW22DRAFT_1357701 [Trametopsis cervina]|nr:hypothetical protein BDW22DRAFT_1357701 [Trametopsis cervina]
MTAPGLVVRRVNPSSDDEWRIVMDVLMRTFSEDHTLEALGDGSASTAKLKIQLTVERSLREGESYILYEGDEPCATAVWMAPGYDWRIAEDPYFLSQVSEEMQEWYSHHFVPKHSELYGLAGLDRSRGRKDAWKLLFLGVLPCHRGKGACKTLIQLVSRKADAESKRILAEVTSPAQVQHLWDFGFTYRSVKNFSSPRFSGFPIWLLVREPGYGGTPRQN